MAPIEALNEIRNDLYRQRHPFKDTASFEAVYEVASQLKAQLKIQYELWSVIGILEDHRGSRNALPKQRATRIKHFVLFVFGKASVGSRFRKTCGADALNPLRGLDYCGLMLLALTYTIEDLLNMDPVTFKCLLPVTQQLTRYHHLSDLLNRGDIDKAVLSLVRQAGGEASIMRVVHDYMTAKSTDSNGGPIPSDMIPSTATEPLDVGSGDIMATHPFAPTLSGNPTYFGPGALAAMQLIHPQQFPELGFR